MPIITILVILRSDEGKNAALRRFAVGEVTKAIAGEQKL